MRRDGVEPSLYLTSWFYRPLSSPLDIPTHNMESVEGIEPSVSAWKAEVLPLYDTDKLVMGSCFPSWSFLYGVGL